MKRLLLALLVFAPLFAQAGEKPNTVLIHPGEVIYARFEAKGKKLKLVSATKEKDEQAQLILTLEKGSKPGETTLKIHNQFDKDVVYKVEMRLLTRHLHQPAVVYPVVAGKLSIDPMAPLADEVAVHDFELIL